MKLKFVISALIVTVFTLTSTVNGNESTFNNPAFEGLKNRVYENIKDGWCSEEKAKLIMDCIICNHPKTCVEIGSFTGSTSLPILASLKYLNHGHAYLIDAWSNQEAIKGLDQDDPNTAWWSTLNMQSVKNQLLHMLSTWELNSYATVIHASSSQASANIPPIDFLHLDGNFSEEGALLDVQLYLPKVNSGGYILISNILVMIGGKPPKMKSLWPLFETCEIVTEIESGNAILFRKK